MTDDFVTGLTEDSVIDLTDVTPPNTREPLDKPRRQPKRDPSIERNLEYLRSIWRSKPGTPRGENSRVRGL